VIKVLPDGYQQSFRLTAITIKEQQLNIPQTIWAGTIVFEQHRQLVPESLFNTALGNLQHLTIT
jgi:hypothetical protein